MTDAADNNPYRASSTREHPETAHRTSPVKSPWSRSILFGTRLVLLLGISVVVFCSFYVGALAAPDWFGEAVVQSCVFTGAGIVALWVVLEVLALFLRRTAWRVWLLIIALAAMNSPWLYILPATLYGQEVAEWDTWHLLPLFAVGNLVVSCVFSGVAFGVVIGLFCWFKPVAKPVTEAPV